MTEYVQLRLARRIQPQDKNVIVLYVCSEADF